MRGLLNFLLLIPLIVASDASRALAAAKSFKLTVAAVESVVKSGGQVRVKIQLKNTSSDEEIFLDGGPCGQTESDVTLEDFHPVVRDANGKEPPLTKWGRRVFRRPNKGEILPDVVMDCIGPPYPVPPGETHTAEIIVSDLYDLSTPGSYDVQIRFDPCKQGVGVPLEQLDSKKECKQEVPPKSVTITVVP
jgi:hypothetical protein